MPAGARARVRALLRLTRARSPSPPQFGPAAVKQARALLDGKGARFITYEKMTHGFAIRGGAHTLEMRAKCAADVTAFFKAAFA